MEINLHYHKYNVIQIIIYESSGSYKNCKYKIKNKQFNKKALKYLIKEINNNSILKIDIYTIPDIIIYKPLNIKIKLAKDFNETYWIPVIQNFEKFRIKKPLCKIERIFPVILYNDNFSTGNAFANILSYIDNIENIDPGCLEYCYEKFPLQFSRKIYRLLNLFLYNNCCIIISFLGKSECLYDFFRILIKLKYKYNLYIKLL